MPADYLAIRDSCYEKKRKNGNLSKKDEQACKKMAAIWYYKKHGKPVNEADGDIMIGKKNIVSYAFANHMDSKLKPEDFCDNVNSVFPLNTEENAVESAKALSIVNDVKKIYDSTEQLTMYSRLLTAMENFSEETNTKIRNILQGGKQVEDKVYTKEEMLAEAEKLAADRVKEATKDSQNQKELTAAKEQLQAKEKELEAKATEAKEAKEKADKLEAEMKAKEDAEKKAALIASRKEALKAAKLEFKKTEKVLAGYLGEWDDATFDNFKNIVVEVAEFYAEAAKEKMTDEEMQKKMEDRKKKNTSQSSIVNDSAVLPNAIASESNEFDIMKKILK